MTNDELYALLRDFRRQLVEHKAPHHVVLEYTLMMNRLLNKVCSSGMTWEYDLTEDNK